MPDGPGGEQPVKVVRNGVGGPKRVWKLATRNQTQSGRAPRSSSSEEGRGRSLGPRCRTQRASAHRGMRGSRRSTDGRSSTVRPRGETRRWQETDVPFGGRSRNAIGRPRHEPDAMSRRPSPVRWSTNAESSGTSREAVTGWMENAEEVFGPPWWDPPGSPTGSDLRIEAAKVRTCWTPGTSVLVRTQESGDTATTRHFG
jgi:hypothetical protein